MAMAADHGWNMFIVLSGTIENLRLQTLNRMQKDLNKEGNLIWIGVEHPSKRSQYGERAQDFHFEPTAQSRYFTVCLKNASRLKKLIDWIHADKASHDQMKILVIDDEADQASISNTAVEYKKEQKERKGINKLIVHLVEDTHYNEAQTNTYLETLTGYSKNTISFTVSYLMDFSFQNGYHDQNFAITLPHIKYSQSAHLPAVFTTDEVERILKNIDTDSPIGKRNYAIILLLARLGIRISDVLKLQFHSIDWERKRIYVQQQKTGTAIELPLLEDVGWAIIDYLQNARPITSCQNIFVCHNPPFDQIRNWMAKDISRAVQRAGIRTPPNKTVGAHTFRHSLATNLLNKGVGLTEIAQTLGHASPESTESYIALSMETLRVCALEVNF